MQQRQSNSSKVEVGYFAGPGTPDTQFGSSASPTPQIIATAEAAYKRFQLLASKWSDSHQGGSISAMVTSFSRGAGSAAVFSQMLYEKGLYALDGRELIAPGKEGAVSAALIMDPVLTGIAGNMNFAPNVNNLTVIRAQDEHRSLFRGAEYNDPNVINISVPGNHGDIGGFYDNGLGALYLSSYRTFFSNAGLPISNVNPDRTFDSSAPTVVHSESIASPGHVVNIVSAFTDDSDLPRRYVTVGSTAQTGGGRTKFTDYNGDYVVSGSGESLNVSDKSVYVLPGATASVTGTGNVVYAWAQSNVNVRSTAQVSSDSGVPVGTGSGGTLITGNPTIVLAKRGASVTAIGENIFVEAEEATHAEISEGPNSVISSGLDGKTRGPHLDHTIIDNEFDADGKITKTTSTHYYGTEILATKVSVVGGDTSIYYPSGQYIIAGADGSFLQAGPGYQLLYNADGSGSWSGPGGSWQCNSNGVFTGTFSTNGSVEFLTWEDPGRDDALQRLVNGIPQWFWNEQLTEITYTMSSSSIRETLHFESGRSTVLSSDSDPEYYSVGGYTKKLEAPGPLAGEPQGLPTSIATVAGEHYNAVGRITTKDVELPGNVGTSHMEYSTWGRSKVTDTYNDGRKVITTYLPYHGPDTILETLADGSNTFTKYSAVGNVLSRQRTLADGTVVDENASGAEWYTDGNGADHIVDNSPDEFKRFLSASNRHVTNDGVGMPATEYMFNAAGGLYKSFFAKGNARSETLWMSDGSYVTSTHSAAGEITLWLDLSGRKMRSIWSSVSAGTGEILYARDGSFTESWTTTDGIKYTREENSNGNFSQIKFASNGDPLEEDLRDSSRVTTTYYYETVRNNDGSYIVTKDNKIGRTVVTHYDVSHVRTFEQWSTPDGTHGDISYHGDGSHSSVLRYVNGMVLTLEVNSFDKPTSGSWSMDGSVGNLDIYSDGTLAVRTELATSRYLVRQFTSAGEWLTEGIQDSGSSSDDIIVGDQGSDELSGGGGADSIHGGNGSDLIFGGHGDDSLSGDLGDDTYLYTLGDGNDNIEFRAGVGRDILQFGADITPSSINRVRIGDDLLLRFIQSGTEIRLSGWYSLDGARLDGLGPSIAFIDGTRWEQADTYDNATKPTSGADILFADELGMSLLGLGGNDVFHSRAGNDHFFGGAGKDTYVFEQGFGHDKVHDDDVVESTRSIVRFGAGILPTDLSISRDGDSLLLRVQGSDDTVLIEDWRLKATSRNLA